MSSQSAQKESVTLDRLQLDVDNPRLPESIHKNEQSIIDYIAQNTAIEDLVNAIASNDFFPGEPLIVVEEGKNLIVVEGNRRLTALKLLQNPNLTSEPSNRLREIVESAKYKPTTIPVIICSSREDVLPYLGFRHITGVKQWDPLAKARYIKQLYDLSSEDFDDKYRGVANKIGSRRDHIKRSLDALAVYNIIEENSFYDIPGLDESSIKFSVLSTALADEKISSYVGLDISSGQSYALKLDHVRSLVEWLFKKNKDGRAVVAESRNIRQLSKVVADDEARYALEKGSSLSYAYRLTNGVNDDFDQAMYEAEAALTIAVSHVSNIEFSDSRLDLARELSQQIILIGKTIRDKNRDDEDAF
jgi:hypothetical protein